MASPPPSAPVPLAIARSMLSLGMRASLAFWMALASAALPAGSPPPSRAATWIARASLVKRLPRFASVAPFLRLIWAHLECPAIGFKDTKGSTAAPGRVVGYAGDAASRGDTPRRPRGGAAGFGPRGHRLPLRLRRGALERRAEHAGRPHLRQRRGRRRDLLRQPRSLHAVRRERARHRERVGVRRRGSG